MVPRQQMPLKQRNILFWGRDRFGGGAREEVEQDLPNGADEARAGAPRPWVWMGGSDQPRCEELGREAYGSDTQSGASQLHQRKIHRIGRGKQSAR